MRYACSRMKLRSHNAPSLEFCQTTTAAVAANRTEPATPSFHHTDTAFSRIFREAVSRDWVNCSLPGADGGLRISRHACLLDVACRHDVVVSYQAPRISWNAPGGRHLPEDLRPW